MQVELRRFDELSAVDLDQWRNLRASDPQYASAFFDPQFTRVVSRTKGHVRILIARNEAGLQLIWPLHVGIDRMGAPIGAPFSDMNGPIFAPGFDEDIGHLLRQVGISGARVSGSYDVQRRLNAGIAIRDGANMVDLTNGADAYFAWQREHHPKHAKKMRRMRRKVEREIGDLVFTFDDRDPDMFDQIIAWKRDQYARTGMHDVLGSGWSTQMLRQLWYSVGPGCRGVMHTLKCDGRLIAGEINVISDTILHGWVTAYDNDYASYSPGLLLMDDTISVATSYGIRLIDLGVGGEHYKKHYASYQVPLDEGILWSPGVISQARKHLDAIWHALEDARIPALSKVLMKFRRRFTLIRDSEVSVGRRIRGVVRALSHAPSRMQTGSTRDELA